MLSQIYMWVNKAFSHPINQYFSNSGLNKYGDIN